MTEPKKFMFVGGAAAMAEFVDGRVKPVSVLKSAGANVVMFSFDSGAELREHTALYPALLQATEGELTVHLAGEQIILRPGDLLHIEPQVPHSVTASQRARMQLTVLLIDSPGPSHVPLSGRTS